MIAKKLTLFSHGSSQIVKVYRQSFEKKINEYTKPNQYVPKQAKYKHSHISGNDSSFTFEIRTVNLEEKCTLSNQINL